MRASLGRRAGAVVLAVLASACGSRNSVLLEDEVGRRFDDATALLQEGEQHFARREDRVQVHFAIARWEEAARTDPTRPDVWLKLSYAYYWLAHGHLRFAGGEEEAMRRAYDKGIVAAEHALKLLAPQFAARVKAGESWEEAVKTAGAEALPALYWYATNLGKWALLEGIVKTLRYKNRIFAIMSRVHELDERFWYAGPHRYFGVYYTKIPFPGGDLEKSRQHFERAVALAPHYLETKVLFASEYAVKAQDEELFRRLLGEVLATPDDVLPDLVPENRVAKKTAQQLLDSIEEYF
ncbi:MAG: hypothetical protein KatS3mg102_1334 [Planctomycetota bacterium]|nr:MAG: hypothetical protein KatS3mg102_1334 [Planctomycetota bacterium]